MDSSFDVPDPSDWLTTPVSKLASVETALRCQVCKDFFNTPVITSCSHTFCSLCIRRCLTSDGKCPTCRAVDQELRLRPNWIVQELVDAFQAARPGVLQLGTDIIALGEAGKQGNRKRKLVVADSDDEDAYLESSPQRRKTRSQKRVDGDQLKDEAEVEGARLNDGLTACPICSKRMKEEEVFPHLDIHNESDKGQNQSVKNIAVRDSKPFLEIGSRSRTQPKIMDRLPQLNYSLLNDNSLRKKLAGLGTPSGGARSVLIRRHTEWVNLVNSNCDSRRPKTKRELLHELDIWERAQDHPILNNNGSVVSSVMDKGFNGAAWASKHDKDFHRLISEARQKAKAPKILKYPNEDRVNAGQMAESVPPGQVACGRDDGHNNGVFQAERDGSDVDIVSRSPNNPSAGAFIDLDAVG